MRLNDGFDVNGRACGRQGRKEPEPFTPTLSGSALEMERQDIRCAPWPDFPKCDPESIKKTPSTLVSSMPIKPRLAGFIDHLLIFAARFWGQLRFHGEHADAS
jgi:hypothetical protein